MFGVNFGLHIEVSVFLQMHLLAMKHLYINEVRLSLEFGNGVLKFAVRNINYMLGIPLRWHQILSF